MKRFLTFLFVITITIVWAKAQTLEPGVGGSIKFVGMEGDSLLSENNPFGGANLINGELFFKMWRDGIGAEFFKLTADEEIQLVADLVSGEGSGDPTSFLYHNGNLYFASNTEGNGRELHVWDGSSVNMILDLHADTLSSNPSDLSPFGDEILFTAEDAVSTQDGVSKRHLWITDGTEAGTRRLSAPSFYGVEATAVGEGPNQPDIPNNGEYAFFAGTDSIHGNEMWITNGEAEPFGTRLLLDVRVGSSGSNASQLTAMNDKQMHFRAETDADWDGRTEQFDFYNNESWVTDGTVKGTYFLGDYADRAETGDPRATIKGQAAGLQIFDGSLVYRVDNGENHVEPTRLNGKIGDFQMLANINGPNNGGVDQASWWQNTAALDGKLFAKAESRQANHSYQRVGQELYAYDPELDSVFLVADIFAGATTNSNPRNLAAINGKIYMAANSLNNNEGIDVWVIDPKGDDNDPIGDVTNLSKLDDYSIYKIYDDVDDTNQGNLGLGQLTQGPFLDFNGKVFFGNYYNKPMLYDDGSANKVFPHIDPKQEIMVPLTGEINAFVNAPPVVSLTSPENNSGLDEGTPATLSVDVSDPEGDVITKVEYYYGTTFENRTLIGTSTEGDYSFMWEVPVPTGGEPTKIFAIAYTDEDPNLGHLAPDSTLSMFSTVVIEGNIPPTIAWSGPNNGEEFVEGFSVAFSVITSEDVEVVHYLVDGDTVASVTDNDFAFIWENPPVGDYTIQSVALDNLGAKATTEELQISVMKILLTTDMLKELIYPNPTLGKINIGASNNFSKLEVVGLTGQVLIEKSKLDAVETIDISNLKAGIYILRLTTTGGQLLTERLIKK